MSKGTVCVVGCNGFVGSHVTATLLGAGFSVRGTLRDPVATRSRWVESALSPLAKKGANLTLHTAHAADLDALTKAMQGCDGVINCAGAIRQEHTTVNLMTVLAGNVCDAAQAAGVRSAVFTSSTGSTNPSEGEPELKNELDHWSDDQVQLDAGKYAAAAKTRYDRKVLEKAEASKGGLRAAIINPSMIVGPCYQPEPVTSLTSFAAIISGKRMKDAVPNSSMSMIDVRDLAQLHVAALLNDKASGRYFGVKKSWHWQDILAELGRQIPSYTPPEPDPDQTPATPTRFDLSRQNTLDVDVRDLDAIISGLVAELRRREMI